MARVGTSLRTPERSRHACGLVLLASLPTLAAANVPVPSLIGMAEPLFLSLKTVGLLFAAIVLIEAALVRIGTDIEWKRLLLTLLAANVASSLVGLLIAGSPSMIWVLLALTLLFRDQLRTTTNLSNGVALLLGSLPLVLTVGWAFITFPEGRALTRWAVCGALVPGFALTVFIEATVIRRMLKPERLWPRVLVANGATYALLLAILLLKPFDPHHDTLATTDYYYTIGKGAARRGNVQLAHECASALLSNWEGDAHTASWALEIAELMAGRGDIHRALDIVRATPHDARDDPDWGGRVRDRIATIEAIGRRAGAIADPKVGGS